MIRRLCVVTSSLRSSHKYCIYMDDDKIDYHVHVEAKFNKVRDSTCPQGPRALSDWTARKKPGPMLISNAICIALQREKK